MLNMLRLDMPNVRLLTTLLMLLLMTLQLLCSWHELVLLKMGARLRFARRRCGGGGGGRGPGSGSGSSSSISNSGGGSSGGSGQGHGGGPPRIAAAWLLLCGGRGSDGPACSQPTSTPASSVDVPVGEVRSGSADLYLGGLFGDNRYIAHERRRPRTQTRPWPHRSALTRPQKERKPMWY